MSPDEESECVCLALQSHTPSKWQRCMWTQNLSAFKVCAFLFQQQKWILGSISAVTVMQSLPVCSRTLAGPGASRLLNVMLQDCRDSHLPTSPLEWCSAQPSKIVSHSWWTLTEDIKDMFLTESQFVMFKNMTFRLRDTKFKSLFCSFPWLFLSVNVLDTHELQSYWSDY